MYVYIRSEPSLWTVGFYRPDGTWEPDSDHDSPDDAAKRVAWLNGGEPPSMPDLERALQRISTLEEKVHDIEQLSPAGAFDG